MTNARVEYSTSVHPYYNIRIFHKECRTLAEAGYVTSMVVPIEEAAVFTKDGVTIMGVKQGSGPISCMKASVLEVMVHPNFIFHGVLVDALSGEELAPQLKKLKELEEEA